MVFIIIDLELGVKKSNATWGYIKGNIIVFVSMFFFFKILLIFGVCIVACSTLRDNKNLSNIQEDAFEGATGPSFL